MTVAIPVTDGIIPRLSHGDGWTYRPDTLTGQDFVTESGRQRLKSQARLFVRRTPAHDRDPVANALLLDALLRMEHNHALTSATLADFLNTEYRQYSWSPIIIGRMMANLAEAALAAPVPPDELPIKAARHSDRLRYRVNTAPRAWRWLLSMRHKIGVMAETALAEDTHANRVSTFWADFPWEIAESI